MDEDQRFVDARPDVLTYRGEPLKAETTIVGPIACNLFVSTTGTDADFVVKIIDVYPDDSATQGSNAGAEILVRGDVMRAKFRNHFDKPEAIEPGHVTQIRFDLPDICHTFKAGHRIELQVQSSWFPIVDRNPQKFTDIYAAKASDFKKATIQLYRSAKYPSFLSFGVR